MRAAVLLGIDFRAFGLVICDVGDLYKTTCHIRGFLYGIRKSQAAGFLQDQAVYDNAYGVLDLLVQGKALVQHVHGPVDAHSLIAGLLCILEDLLVFALPAQGHRCHDHDPGTLASAAVDGIDYLVHGHAADGTAAGRTVDDAYSCPEESVVVIDFGDCSDG